MSKQEAIVLTNICDWFTKRPFPVAMKEGFSLFISELVVTLFYVLMNAFYTY